MVNSPVTKSSSPVSSGTCRNVQECTSTEQNPAAHAHAHACSAAPCSQCPSVSGGCWHAGPLPGWSLNP
eukprot:4245223-Alexandrium_andersonii.AAC.1